MRITANRLIRTTGRLLLLIRGKGVEKCFGSLRYISMKVMIQMYHLWNIGASE